MFIRTDLDELIACDTTPAVSIYLPTHSVGRETRQDAIRLRNLLSTADKRLTAERPELDIGELLEPARNVLDDGELWRSQAQGLALFLAPGFSRIHKLPIDVAEEVAVGNHFCIRQLLPLIETTGWYWVLTVTSRSTRLYQGSRWDFAETGGLDLPQGIAGVRGETEYQDSHYASPTGRRGPSGLAKAQVYGESPDELHKTQLIELLHRIATAVEVVIKRQPGPVILVAQPEVQGNLRDLAHWNDLLPEGILENPDAMTEDELHGKAWELFAPRADTIRDDVLGRLHSLIGTANGKATTKAEEIVKAARYGRIDRLFLSGGAPLWGQFIEAQDRVVAHGNPVEGDDDLLDYAALMTLRQGGHVTLVDRAQLPPDGPAAAILRY